MAKDENTYVSQFTVDNILELKNTINKSINDYAESKGNQKLDLFVILASLQQSAYELVMRSMPDNDEEAKKASATMKLVADKLIATVDSTRKELDTKAMDELLGSIHSISIIAEFYVRRRDEYLNSLQDKAQQMSTDNVVPMKQDESIKH